jgi:hypothetical protein
VLCFANEAKHFQNARTSAHQRYESFTHQSQPCTTPQRAGRLLVNRTKNILTFLNHERTMPWLGLTLFVLVYGFWHSRVWPLTPDGAHYMMIGRELAERGQLIDPIGYVGHPSPRTGLHWPPLYPMLIAAFLRFGTMLDVARTLSFVGVAVAVFTYTSNLARYVPASARLGVVVWLALLPAVTWHAELIGSEGVALGLVGTTFLLLERLRKAPHAASGFLLGLACGAAVATKWSLVALAAPTALALWRSLRAQRAGARSHLLATVAGACVVLLPLLMWRWTVGDGPRDPSTHTVFSLMHDTAIGTGKSWGVQALGGGTLPLFIALGCSQDERTHSNDDLLWEHVAFVGALLTVVVLGAHSYRVDTIGTRLLSPASMSVAVVTMLVAIRLSPRVRSRFAPMAWIALFVVATTTHWAFLSHWNSQRRERAVTEVMVSQMAGLVCGTRVYTEVPEVIPLRPDLKWERLQSEPNGDPIDVHTLRTRCSDQPMWVLSAAQKTTRERSNAEHCAGVFCLYPVPCEM